MLQQFTGQGTLSQTGSKVTSAFFSPAQKKSEFQRCTPTREANYSLLAQIASRRRSEAHFASEGLNRRSLLFIHSICGQEKWIKKKEKSPINLECTGRRFFSTSAPRKRKAVSPQSEETKQTCFVRCKGLLTPCLRV